MSSPQPRAALASAAVTAPPATRLRALDGLRGAAILLVLAYHFSWQPDVEHPIAQLLLAPLQAGWAGVDLFFVLSGFLITGLLLDDERKPRMLWRFYGRRALRILPLYYGALAVLLLLTVALPGADPARDPGAALWRDQAWYWLHGANVVIARDDHWASASSVQHFWSLAVEEQFYLLWPAVVLLLPRRWLPRAIGVLVVGALLVRVGLAVVAERALAAYVLTPARVDALAIGALLALAWRSPAWHAQVTRAALWLVPLAGAALLGIVTTYGPGGHGLLMATVGHTYWMLLFASLLWLGIVPKPTAGTAGRVVGAWRATLEDQRWLHWFARYSYGLYVVHVPIRQWLLAHDFGVGDLVARHGAGLGTVAALGLGTLASIAVAVPLWHLFERPILVHGGARLDAWLARTRRRTSVRAVQTAAESH